MTGGWTIVVDRERDLAPAEGAWTVMSARRYIAEGARLKPATTRIINLTRSYAYLGIGYYVSLLAEARGHRVLPTVDATIELSQRALYRFAVPELEQDLARRVRRFAQPPEQSFRLLIAFGQTEDSRFARFASRVFDQFRMPLIEIRVRVGGAGRDGLTIAGVAAVPLGDLSEAERDWVRKAMGVYTRRGWRGPKIRSAPRWTLAVLHNPKEEMPPSSPKALQRLARVAATMGVAVELIEKKDFVRLAEYDALFIRETTAIDHHTYRFARRAEQEGLPVIDDPTSIRRCANKVFLADLLSAHRVPTPRTIVVDSARGLARIGSEIGFPAVLKIPDGSFSRGVFKAADAQEAGAIGRRLLAESDLILAQEYMYTAFDWRVGVLDGEPLFACRYMMAKKHWQIVRHDADGSHDEGRFETLAVEDAPAEVISTAVRAARLIGRGLYGVDLKETERGIFVIEVNDNPNIDAGIEDRVLRDALWRRLVRWFVDRLEAQP